MKKVIIVLLTALLVLNLALPVMALEDLSVNINGITLSFDKEIVEEDGVVYLPLRDLARQLGAFTSYNAETKNVTVTIGDDLFYLKQNKDMIIVNGSVKKLSGNVRLLNGTTYVPNDFIDEAFLYETTKENGELSIYTPSLNLHFTDAFEVTYNKDGSKVIVDAEGNKFLLVDDKDDYKDGYEEYTVIERGLTNTFQASATGTGSMVSLGLTDKVGTVTTPSYAWSLEEVVKGLDSGLITFVGGDGMTPPDYELIAANEPSLAFCYTGSYGQQDMIAKLEELGIKSAINNEYLETHYLGRLEWNKFMGAFFDKEFEAEYQLNRAVKHIENTKAIVAGQEKPLVAWGSSWMGTVYAPNVGSYVSKMIDAAGGEYVYEELGVGIDGSTPISIEDFYDNSKDADLFVYATSINYMMDPSINGVIADGELFGEIKAVKEGNVYVYYPGWFQTIPQTHINIRELAKILYPDLFDDEVEKYIKLD